MNEANDQAGLDEAIGHGRIMRLAEGRIFLNERTPRDRRESLLCGMFLSLWVLASIAESMITLVNH